MWGPKRLESNIVEFQPKSGRNRIPIILSVGPANACEIKRCRHLGLQGLELQEVVAIF